MEILCGEKTVSAYLVSRNSLKKNSMRISFVYELLRKLKNVRGHKRNAAERRGVEALIGTSRQYSGCQGSHFDGRAVRMYIQLIR